MKHLIAWFAHNSVASNLLMVFLLIGGFVMIGQIKAEILPQIDPRVITVTVSYPGATPADVADAITARVEDAVLGLEGVDRVRTSATEGLGSVTIELDDFADAYSVREETSAAIGRLLGFPPENAEQPEIAIAKAISPVARIVVVGNVDERSLKHAGEELERGLRALDEITIVSLQGTRNYEIAIEIAQSTLEQYGLTIEQLAAVIRAESVNLPAGSVRTSGGDVMLRANSEARDAPALSDIVVLSDADGRRVTLSDIATVRDEFTEDPLLNTYNGEPAIFVQIERAPDEDFFSVRDAMTSYLDTYQPPQGVEVIVTADATEAIKDRINLLTRNGILGLCLVFGLLALTLDLRLAVWVCTGILVAFLGGSLLFGQFVTINMVALMALILVLGIVVDDAIVVGESIFEAQSRNDIGPQTAVDGTRAVLAPVSIGVLTSMIAFATLLQLTGVLGQLLQPVPIVVLSVLFVSLVEVFLVLPGHLSHGNEWSVGLMQRIKLRVQKSIDALRDRVAVPMVELCVRYRYAAIAACLGILLATLGLVSGGHVRFVFFPAVESDNVTLRLEMPAGTPFDQTRQATEHVVNAAFESIGGRESNVYRSVSVTVGGQLASGFNARGTLLRPELAVASIELVPSSDRVLSSAEIERRWREAAGRIPGVKSLAFESAGLSGGDDVSLNVTHPEPSVLARVVDEIRSNLDAIDGVAEIEASNDAGQRQIELELTPAGNAAGLSVTDLTRQVRNAYFGEEVQRFQRGREEVKVFVRLPAAERRSLADLTNMLILLPNGEEATLGSVAAMTESRSFTSIESINGQRIVNITADVDEAVTTPGDVQALLAKRVLPALQSQHPALEIGTDGQARSQAEELDSLTTNFLIALLAIYVLLASVLRSYWQPLIIIAIIPFGFVGALLGHMMLGYDLTFLSLFGVVALSGVIINDSIVLIDYFNQLQRRSGTLYENITRAARRRFRPILLTTLTTFVGLLPMIFETSMQAQFLIPMAVSLAFGILFSSVVLLLLVPALLALRPGPIRRPRPDGTRDEVTGWWAKPASIARL